MFEKRHRKAACSVFVYGLNTSDFHVVYIVVAATQLNTVSRTHVL